jgi:outer membrane receptor protein involved in Fe transport
VITSGGGEVRVKGLELEMEARLVPELTLEVTIRIADSEIVKTNCTICLSITANANPVGKQLPVYPKMKGTLSATYRRPLFDDTDGYIRLDYIYTGKIYETEGNVAWLVPTSKFNLRVGGVHVDTRLEVYGTNIFDQRHPSALAKPLTT